MNPDLEKGRVYTLDSRHLTEGVYDGNGGFIGIRTKFGQRYLDVEYIGNHSFGTVRAYKATGRTLPEDIGVWIYADISIDAVTGKAVRYDKANGTWRYLADGSDVDEKGSLPEQKGSLPMAISNTRLFSFLNGTWEEGADD